MEERLGWKVGWSVGFDWHFTLLLPRFTLPHVIIFATYLLTYLELISRLATSFKWMVGCCEGFSRLFVCLSASLGSVARNETLHFTTSHLTSLLLTLPRKETAWSRPAYFIHHFSQGYHFTSSLLYHFITSSLPIELPLRQTPSHLPLLTS